MIQPRRGIGETLLYAQKQPVVRRRSREDVLVAAVKSWQRIGGTESHRRERIRPILSEDTADSQRPQKRRVIGLSASGERKRKREAAYLEAAAMRVTGTLRRAGRWLLSGSRARSAIGEAEAH